MAIESAKIQADVIEVSEFPDVAERYQVYGVPKVVLNEKNSFEGALPEPQFLSNVVGAASLIIRP